MDRKDAMAGVIKLWKAENGRSLNLLSDKAEVGYSTVRAIADGKSDPNGETALRILLYIYRDDIPSVHRFVVEHYPELTRYTKSLCEMGAKGFDFGDLTNTGIRIFLEIICSSEGLSEKRAEEIGGSGSTRQLEKLLEHGVIQKRDTVLFGASEAVYILSSALQKKIGLFAIDNIDKAQSANYLKVIFNGVTIEASREVYQIIDEASERIAAVLMKPENRGNEKIITTLGMTKL